VTAIGFLGFGEAGSTIASGMSAAGFDDLLAYDIAQDTVVLIRERADRIGVTIVDDPAALAAGADVVVSAVVCNEAENAAASIVEHLVDGMYYLDINSVAPDVKRRIAEKVEPEGAAYVDVAVMANVSSDFSRLPLLLAGSKAGEVTTVLDRAELRATVVSDQPGEAARVKMFRSLFVKGLEALALEAMLACYPSGVHERVLESFEESFGGYTFPELIRHLIERHAVHGERRANELHEVAESLREVGVDPIMAEAGQVRMKWDVERGLQKHYKKGEDPDWIDVLEVLDALRRQEG
jgi:3-hydroxyisobutyrate dehydrogenase-like beta-hydroxyacid dehydrogenase